MKSAARRGTPIRATGPAEDALDAEAEADADANCGRRGRVVLSALAAGVWRVGGRSL